MLPFAILASGAIKICRSGRNTEPSFAELLLMLRTCLTDRSHQKDFRYHGTTILTLTHYAALLSLFSLLTEYSF